MLVILTIETGSDAFYLHGPEIELARILREQAGRLENRGPLAAGDEYVIADINGNRCGKLQVSA